MVAMADRLSYSPVAALLWQYCLADRFAIALNGRSLAGEFCRRIRKSERDAFTHSGPRNFLSRFPAMGYPPGKGR